MADLLCLCLNSCIDNFKYKLNNIYIEKKTFLKTKSLSTGVMLCTQCSS